MSRPDTPIWIPLTLSFVLLGSLSFGADFDPTPSILSASEVLGADLVNGEHHEVVERVENDGYMNNYRISSDFGRFEAYGNLQLAVRVLEIGALAELDRLSKSEVFAEAAKKSAMSSIDTRALRRSRGGVRGAQGGERGGEGG
jgi:hypothetical protein